MKTTAIARLALCAACVALGLTSCHKKKDAMHGDEIMPVSVAQAIVDSVTISKTFPGTLASNNSVDIVARVNGNLTGKYYTDGGFVKKGQLLFTIEDTQYKDAVQQAQAALSTGQSQLEYNSKHYAALQKALESDAVAQIQVLQAKSAVEQSQADVKNAQAALQTASTNLGYCTIRAPFDGEITMPTMSVGAYVNGAGAPVKLATIFDNSQLFADFYIDDNAYLRSLSNSDNPKYSDYGNVPVAFSDTLPHKYTGRVEYLAPSVDVSTGTLLMRLVIQNPYNELRNGMYCSVILPYSYDAEAVLVNDAAISTTQTAKYLYVVNDSNTVVYTPIEVGDMANDSMRIVTKGLKGGETYVTKALLKVRPGMKVKPIR